MDTSVLLATLTLLATGLAFSLYVQLRTIRAVHHLRPAPAVLPLGHPVPQVSGRSVNGERRALHTPGQSAAWLFLEINCPKCRATLPQLKEMLPLAKQAGLPMSIISQHPPRRLRPFFDAPVLLDAIVQVTARELNIVNPTLASPSYAFIDDDGVLLSLGFIGDADWLSFRAQLDEQQVAA